MSFTLNEKPGCSQSAECSISSNGFYRFRKAGACSPLMSVKPRIFTVCFKSFASIIYLRPVHPSFYYQRVFPSSLHDVSYMWHNFHLCLFFFLQEKVLSGVLNMKGLNPRINKCFKKIQISWFLCATEPSQIEPAVEQGLRTVVC